MAKELTLKDLHDLQGWGYDPQGFSYTQRYITALEKRIAELEIELHLANNLDPSGEFHEPDW